MITNSINLGTLPTGAWSLYCGKNNIIRILYLWKTYSKTKPYLIFKDTLYLPIAFAGFNIADQQHGIILLIYQILPPPKQGIIDYLLDGTSQIIIMEQKYLQNLKFKVFENFVSKRGDPEN